MPLGCLLQDQAHYERALVQCTVDMVAALRRSVAAMSGVTAQPRTTSNQKEQVCRIEPASEGTCFTLVTPRRPGGSTVLFGQPHWPP